MVAATENHQTSYYLAEDRYDWVPWLVVSLFFHFAIFGAAWSYTRYQHSNTPVIRHAIMVEPVRWAPEKRKKYWLPVKNTVKAQAVEEEKIKVSKTAEKSQELSPEEEKKKKKAEAKKRRQRMARALAKLQQGKTTRIDGSPDGVVGGTSSRTMEILGSAYASQLRDIFRNRWEVPGIIPKAELKRLSCKILVEIDLAGNIVSHSLKSGSGNRMFDSSAMRAVKMTRSVPLPDELIRDVVMKQGILVNFSRKD